MGLQRLIILTAFLLLVKEYGVSAQYATVMECLPQATATIARPIVQPAGQFVLPAIIQPILPGYDAYGTDLATGFGSNYGNAPAPFPGFPPIILDDDNDIWHHLLYFLIFAMRNKRANYNIPPPSYGGGCSCNCGCSGSSKCGCSCECPNCNKNNNNCINFDNNSCSSGPTYIPIPIAIPVYTGADGCRYIDGFSDDILIQPSIQACNTCSCNSCNTCNGRENNEINLIIKAE